ncbi:hypothetical protein Trydic_g8366 [Trypoxylus dichotomus]
MGNWCPDPHQETPGVPELDTAKGPQRFLLVRNTTIQEDARVEPLIRRITTRLLGPPRAEVSGIRPQDPMEVRPPTVTRRNWHPDEVETTFPPRRRHNSFEPKGDRVAGSLGELLQDGKERPPTALRKIRSSRRWIE